MSSLNYREGEPRSVDDVLRRLNWTPYAGDEPGAPSVHPRREGSAELTFWIDVEDRITATLKHGNTPELVVRHVRHDYLMRLVSGGEPMRVGRLCHELVDGEEGDRYDGLIVERDVPIGVATDVETWLGW